MKRKNEEVTNNWDLSADEFIEKVACSTKHRFTKRYIFPVLAICIIVPLMCICNSMQSMQSIELGDDEIALATAPVAATSSKKSLLVIPQGRINENPFLPYKDFGESKGAMDVPNFDLIEPPEFNATSDAVRVMNTVVSGILYDKYSPSAILNIEGNDYLVRKGDVVNNYEVVNILRDAVTVRLGKNVYTAGIGEILTSGALNKNEVSNIEKKFGGEKNEV